MSLISDLSKYTEHKCQTHAVNLTTIYTYLHLILVRTMPTDSEEIKNVSNVKKFYLNNVCFELKNSIPELIEQNLINTCICKYIFLKILLCLVDADLKYSTSSVCLTSFLPLSCRHHKSIACASTFDSL